MENRELFEKVIKIIHRVEAMTLEEVGHYCDKELEIKMDHSSGWQLKLALMESRIEDAFLAH